MLVILLEMIPCNLSSSILSEEEIGGNGEEEFIIVKFFNYFNSERTKIKIMPAMLVSQPILRS
jgi:hypothetical protein